MGVLLLVLQLCKDILQNVILLKYQLLQKQFDLCRFANYKLWSQLLKLKKKNQSHWEKSGQIIFEKKKQQQHINRYDFYIMVGCVRYQIELINDYKSYAPFFYK